MTTQPPTTERPAQRGELCTCGRQAVVVFTGGPLGDTDWCGAQSTRTDCAWCDQPRHRGRCPEYRPRPATDAREQLVRRGPVAWTDLLTEVHRPGATAPGHR